MSAYPRPEYIRGKKIIQRLSKYRWLSPTTISELCGKLSNKYGGLHSYYIAKFPTEAQYAVGIYRGHPPALLGDENYSAVLRIVQDKKQLRDDSAIEIALLKTAIKPFYTRSSIYD